SFKESSLVDNCQAVELAKQQMTRRHTGSFALLSLQDYSELDFSTVQEREASNKRGHGLKVNITLSTRSKLRTYVIPCPCSVVMFRIMLASPRLPRPIVRWL